LLGALVGGGEELSFVEFAPGQSTIGETELAKVEKLSKALFERPALNLEMTGSADDTLDRAALAWMKLERALKSARMAEVAGKPDAPASVEDVRFEPRDYTRLLKANYKRMFNRDRPLPAVATNAVAGTATNPVPTPARKESRKGAEAQITRDVLKPAAKSTNAPASAPDPRTITRPASLPALAANDEVLARMESELHAQTEVTPDDLRGLRQARAQSVQRALLKTGKVTPERLFILTPAPGNGATNAQSRVNLSLN